MQIHAVLSGTNGEPAKKAPDKHSKQIELFAIDRKQPCDCEIIMPFKVCVRIRPGAHESRRQRHRTHFEGSCHTTGTQQGGLSVEIIAKTAPVPTSPHRCYGKDGFKYNAPMPCVRQCKRDAAHGDDA